MSKIRLTIRRYAKTDEDAVFDLHIRAITPTGAHLKNRDEDFKNLESIYIEAGGDFFVGTLDGKIVAIGGLKKISDSVAEITKVRVDPLFQGKGCGQQILDALEERARELGFPLLELNTSTVQVAAQRLYEKNGYKEYKREVVDGIPNIFYRKELF